MTVQTDQSPPDWGGIGTTLSGILLALGGLVTAWQKWGKGSVDHQKMTLDGAFQLVTKQKEYADLLEVRNTALEVENENLRRENQELKTKGAREGPL